MESTTAITHQIVGCVVFRTKLRLVDVDQTRDRRKPVRDDPFAHLVGTGSISTASTALPRAPGRWTSGLATPRSEHVLECLHSASRLSRWGRVGRAVSPNCTIFDVMLFRLDVSSRG